MTKAIFIILMAFTSTVLFGQSTPLYVGSYTSNGSEGVHVYDFNQKTGEANFQHTIKASNPSFLARKADMLYMVNENNDGMLSAYDLKQSRFLNALPTEGAHPCHVSLSPTEPLVVASNYSGGSLILYSLNSDGSLNKKEDFIQFNKSSINKDRQKQSHIHSAFFSKDGKYLFVSDLGGDIVYKIEVRKEVNNYSLAVVDEIAIKKGGGPRHVVVAKDGKRIYVVLELTGEIELLEDVNGVWTSKQIVPIYHPGFDGEHGAADIKMSADGKYLYATNRGTANEIVTYKVSKNGLLDIVQILSVEGNSPRNVQLSPNGKWVFMSNQLTGQVTVFERNSRNGKLKFAQKALDIPSAVCTIF